MTKTTTDRRKSTEGTVSVPTQSRASAEAETVSATSAVPKTSADLQSLSEAAVSLAAEALASGETEDTKPSKASTKYINMIRILAATRKRPMRELADQAVSDFIALVGTDLNLPKTTEPDDDGPITSFRMRTGYADMLRVMSSITKLSMRQLTDRALVMYLDSEAKRTGWRFSR